jgi:uncharacterized protein (UPF0548 family)
MFLLTRPDRFAIDQFLDRTKYQSFSYLDIGVTQEIPGSGYNVDYNETQLGSGTMTFERAKQAVRDWKMFDFPWVDLCWPDTPIRVGQNVAIVARHFGFYSLNASRIVYTIDEPYRFGFAYGTLTEHSEIGEERFSVEYHVETGEVWYVLRAISRPGHILARLGYPISRHLQHEFAKDSLAAMRRAVDSVTGLTGQ